MVTAAHHKIPVKIILINNGYLGMVRQWQQLFFKRRYSSVELESSNPDFVKLAESCGVVAYQATNREELKTAMEKMLEVNDRPVFIDVRVAPEENCYPMVPAGAALNEMVEEDPK